MAKDTGNEKEGMQGRVKIKPELLAEALKPISDQVSKHGKSR
jgi:hypothetical protein